MSAEKREISLPGRDRNPAAPNFECPQCGRLTLRQRITTFFIRHHALGCESCGYMSEWTVSEHRLPERHD
jgi:uncharacterized Zn finger protein